MAIEPVQIFELEQPRCALRFGEGACSATGSPKCWNTYGTCPVKDDYDGSGSIRWRFVKYEQNFDIDFGEFDDPDNIATNGIGGLVSVSSTSSKINVSGVLEGKSPFGTRAAFTAVLKDVPFDNHVGDPYDRPMPEHTFWSVWAPRNPYVSGMYARIYEGEKGQALADMRQRVCAVETVNGPDGSGKVTVQAYDPLRLLQDQSFPRVTGMQLVDAISSTQTTIRISAVPADVSDQFGNTVTSYFRVGDEVIGYTGHTEIETGVYDLTGCIRGFDGTQADSAEAREKAQRCARFEDWELWRIQHYILTQHTPLPASFIDFAAWKAEGDTYLPTLRRTVTIAGPVKVVTLAGELCQQGCFNIWWDEAAQTIPLKAVRPPRGTVPLLTGESHIVADSSKIMRKHAEQISRIYVYYSPRSPIKSLSDSENYTRLTGRIEGDTENENATGKIKPLEIHARWIETEAHAYQVISRIFIRYRNVPRFLSIQVSAKDRGITLGDVCDVSLQSLLDTEGQRDVGRWQVIEARDVVPGEVYFLDMQTLELIGRYANWMANDAPDYLDATDEQRATGAFWANDDGEMSNGDPGYNWQ